MERKIIASKFHVRPSRVPTIKSTHNEDLKLPLINLSRRISKVQSPREKSASTNSSSRIIKTVSDKIRVERKELCAEEAGIKICKEHIRTY